MSSCSAILMCDRPVRSTAGRPSASWPGRLQLDLSNVRWREVDPSPSAVEAASGDYDLFINASYGSVLRNRAPKGIYVVHFPIVAGAAAERLASLGVAHRRAPGQADQLHTVPARMGRRRLRSGALRPPHPPLDRR